MASSKVHDRVSKVVGIVAIALLVFFLKTPLAIALCLGLSVFLGSYLLSPDLDTKSHAYRRWLLLRFIWIPYQKLFGHRSRWTHMPILGTLIRVLWIAPLWIPILSLFNPPSMYFTIALIGIEISAWGHYLFDGVPWFR